MGIKNDEERFSPRSGHRKRRLDTMTGLDAIGAVLSHLGDQDIALFTTGLISRRAFLCNDRKANFYMIGSMGLVSSVGLGIALNTAKRVFIFDGDGSVFMDMGTMAMIAQQKPLNLFHIVFDNEAYESTGNQPCFSKEIALDAIAETAGYKNVFKFTNAVELRTISHIIKSCAGPNFILIKTIPGFEKEPPRVSFAPAELALRIKYTIAEEM